MTTTVRRVMTHREFLKMCGLAVLGAGAAQFVQPPTRAIAADLTGDNLYVTGNAGIGTNSPAQKLHVYGGNATTEIRVDAQDGSATNSIIGLANGGIDYGQLYWDNVNNHLLLTHRYSAGYLGLGTNSRTTDLVVANNGNVGIGTTSPDARLDIQDASTTFTALEVTNTDGSTGRWVVLANSNSSTYAPAKGFGIRQPGVATRLVIDANGNVGIGTTCPVFKLQARGSVGSSTQVDGAGAGNGVYLEAVDDASKTYGSRLRYGGDGNNSGAFQIQGVGDTPRLTIDPNGNISVNSVLAIKSDGVAAQAYYAQ